MKRILFFVVIILPLTLYAQNPVQISQPYQFNKYVIVIDSLISKNISLPRQASFPTPKRTGQIVNKQDTLFYYTSGGQWIKISKNTWPEDSVKYASKSKVYKSIHDSIENRVLKKTDTITKIPTNYLNKWTGGNVVYVPSNGDLQTYIDNAPEGSTLEWASYECIRTSKITINKQININGRGRAGIVTIPVTPGHGTLISTSTTMPTGLFDIQHDNVRIANLSINTTGSSSIGINIGHNFKGIVLEHIDLVMKGTGNQQGIVIGSSNVLLNDVKFYNESTNTSVSGLDIWNDATATQRNIVECQNVGGIVQGHGTGAYAFIVENLNTDSIITLKLRETECKSMPGTPEDIALKCTSTTTHKAVIDAYHCTFNGADYDIVNDNANTVNIGISTLEHDKYLGTINRTAAIVSQQFRGDTAKITGNIFAKNYYKGTSIVQDSSLTTEKKVRSIVGDSVYSTSNILQADNLNHTFKVYNDSNGTGAVGGIYTGNQYPSVSNRKLWNVELMPTKIYLYNTSAIGTTKNYSLKIYNSSTGYATYTDNISYGYGHYVDNAANGYAYGGSNNSTGILFGGTNMSTGIGFYLNQFSTGIPFRINYSNVEKIRLDPYCKSTNDSISFLYNSARLLTSTTKLFEWQNNGTAIMTMLGNGNLGIGTVNPLGKLHLNTSSTNSSEIYISATGTGDAGIWLDASNGDFSGGDYANLRQTNDLKLHLNNGLSYLILNEDGQNVGIGTTTPNYKLEVSGSIARTAGTSSTVITTSGILKDFLADSANTGTAKTDLYSWPIPSDVLGNNKEKIIANYFGIFANNSNDKYVYVIFAGDTIFNFFISTSDNIRDNFTIDVFIMRTSSSVARCFVIANSGFGYYPLFTRSQRFTEITSKNWTTSNILKIGAQGGATSDIIAKIGSIKWEPDGPN
jgi:hypothetical protein